MTGLRIILLLLIVPAFTWAQSKALFDSLDERMHRGEISSTEWYYTKLDSGYISEFAEHPWVQSIDLLDRKSELYKSLPKTSGLIFHIPENYQLIEANGNRYIRAYIINLTSKTISIPRKDAVIWSLENYLLVGNEWKQIQTEQLPYCGNGFWTQKLESGHYLSLQIDNYDISLGDVPVKQKMIIKIDGHTLESREIAARLNTKQVEFLSRE